MRTKRSVARGMSGVALCALLLALAGCATGGGGTPFDAGGGGPDSGGASDAGTPLDASAEPLDASVSMDAGTTPDDAGMHDAGSGDAGPSDAGTGDDDAGSSDAGTGDDDAGLPEACANALAAARESFEDGPDGWTHHVMDGVSGTWPFDPWEVGTPSSVGPSSCADGARCWATDLDQNYAQCGRAELRSPSIDLTACAGRSIVLVWEQWYEFWSGSYNGTTWYDGGLVEVSTDGGTTWSPVDPSIYSGTIRINPNRGSAYSCLQSNSFHVHNRPGFVGSSGGWERVEAELFVSGTFRVRFAWASGVSSSTTNANTSRSATAPGWYIDDVRFEAR